MNMQQLRILQELCDGKTLAEAADKLGLAQPTASFHLRKLEEALGLELVVKQARRLRPTEAALALLPYVRRMNALGAELEERATELATAGLGKLRLGASYTPATYLMPPYFAEFQRRHPRVRLHLSVKTAAVILGLLRSYEIDAAVVSLPDDRQEQGLRVQPLVEDELKLVMSPAHRLAGEEGAIGIGDLMHETFLLHEPGSTSRRLTDRWAQEAGLRYESAMELGAIETMKEAVKCNIGLAVLPQRSIVRETASGELVERPLPSYRNQRRICFVCRDEPLLSPNVRLFAEFMRDEFVGRA